MSKLAYILCISVIAWAAATVTNETARPPGFGGFAYGASSTEVSDERAAAGYRLVDQSENGLWYFDSIDGLNMHVGYVFNDDDELVGGSFLFYNGKPRDFERIELVLSRYHPDAAVQLTDDGVIRVMTRFASHSRITHSYEYTSGHHEVIYEERDHGRDD